MEMRYLVRSCMRVQATRPPQSINGIVMLEFFIQDGSSIKLNKIDTVGMSTTDSKALAVAHEQSSPCLPIHYQTVLRILMPRCDVAPSGVLRERWKHVRGVTQAYFQGSSACTTPMATLELYLPTAAIKPAVLLDPLPFFTLRISIS